MALCNIKVFQRSAARFTNYGQIFLNSLGSTRFLSNIADTSRFSVPSATCFHKTQLTVNRCSALNVPKKHHFALSASLHQSAACQKDEEWVKGAVARLRHKYFPKSKYTDGQLSMVANQLYMQINENTDVMHFFKVLELEDTLYSWFKVLQLQIWLSLVRLGSEGEAGDRARKMLCKVMWDDVLSRTRKLGKASLTKQADWDLLQAQFKYNVMSFDEGLLAGDTVLAGALWQGLLRVEENTPSGPRIVAPSADPRVLESLVAYVREQVKIMDQIPSEQFMENPKIRWIRLKYADEML